MKVIDLLNKIANGEEVPKKIKYKNKIYEWKEYDVCYGKIMTKKGWVKELGYVAKENETYFYLKHCYQDLNDEIEIIEEDKKIKKLKHAKEDDILVNGKSLLDKIDEIIDEVNKLKDDRK